MNNRRSGLGHRVDRCGESEFGGSSSATRSILSEQSKEKKKKNRSAEFWVEKPEVVCAPPPIVRGYALPGFKAMPSTGINHENNCYECFVCDSPCSTEEMLNIHLSGKPHIRKLEKAGWNSFLKPEPLGPIPGIQKIKDAKWRTGIKKTLSEIDPTIKGHFTCKPCEKEFDSRIIYENHMKGKPHARTLKWIEEIKKNDGHAHCYPCKFIATSATHMESHVAGKNHKQKMELVKRGLPGGIPLIAEEKPVALPKQPLHTRPWVDDD